MIFFYILLPQFEKKKKIEEEMKIGNIHNKFAAHYDAVEQKLKQDTIGTIYVILYIPYCIVCTHIHAYTWYMCMYIVHVYIHMYICPSIHQVYTHTYYNEDDIL